jgi:hypothetical protein
VGRKVMIGMGPEFRGAFRQELAALHRATSKPPRCGGLPSPIRNFSCSSKRASMLHVGMHELFEVFWSGRWDSNPRPQPWQG